VKISRFGRTVRSFTQRILAWPQVVFPLLCPVREQEWLEGFEAELIYSKSGVIETGCVFRTRNPGEPESIWMVTRHDREAGAVEFVRVTAGLVATCLLITLETNSDGSTAVHVTYTFTPLSAEGVTLVRERHSETSFQQAMEWWERSMNHFIETGKMLRRENPPA
jgi:hypothetical protein